MNNFKKSKAMVLTAFAVVVIGGLASATGHAEPKAAPLLANTNAAPAKTNAAPAQASAAEPKAKAMAAAKHQLTGAELYSMHCNRCHPERYPTERTAAQWRTILLHMQIRANLPGGQARMILKYLQENSGR